MHSNWTIKAIDFAIHVNGGWTSWTQRKSLVFHKLKQFNHIPNPQNIKVMKPLNIWTLSPRCFSSIHPFIRSIVGWLLKASWEKLECAVDSTTKKIFSHKSNATPILRIGNLTNPEIKANHLLSDCGLVICLGMCGCWPFDGPLRATMFHFFDGSYSTWFRQSGCPQEPSKGIGSPLNPNFDEFRMD